MGDAEAPAPTQVLLDENRALSQRVAELERALARFQSGDGDAPLGHGVGERAALLQEAERIAHMGSWVWDLESDAVMWSEELYRILGYDPEHDTPSTEAFFARVHPEDLPRLMEISQRRIRTGLSERTEYRIVRPDGSVRLALIDGAQIYDPDGKLQRAVGVILDRTEWVQLEEALRQSQKMEAIGQLAGGVAHDFNNLLTVIMGSLELVQPAAGEAHLRMALDAAVSASKLTAQLLAFGRRALVRRQDMDVAAALEDARALIERVIGEHIAIEFELPDGLPPVQADPSQLQQVLLNLALNARDAMPDGGRLSVRATPTEVDAARASAVGGQVGPHVCIEVRDTGCGMSAETRLRAFEPFFTTKQAGAGTGLGLAMVFGAMRQAGGFVELSSEPGQGACFALFLPRASGDASAPGEHAPETEGQGAALGGRILLVEDDPRVAQVTASMLERAGCEVVVRHDPQAALALFGQDCGGFALVVSDILMPGMRGTEMVGQMRTLRPDVRVLYVTGYAEEAGEIEVLPHKTGLLPKPFRRPDLLAAVTGLLRGPVA